MKFDVVIVGAGLGGLSAGATLAQNGKRVHLIESHDKVGGFATNYRRGKYRMEAGIHMLSGDHPHSLYHHLFKQFNINESITLVKSPQFYQCHFNGKSFSMPFGITEAKEKLIKSFPHEKAGVEKFFSTMILISENFRDFIFREPFISATNPFFSAIFPHFEQFWRISIGQFLDGIIQDRELKTILLANVTFYHDKHYELNLVQYMISQINYFLGGGYYIQGGSQVFSDHLKNIIESNGGTITLRHKVEKIKVQNNKATHIYYRKIIGTDQELKACEADFIVYNGAIPNLYEHILEGEDVEYFKRKESKCKQWGLSTSASTLYFGLKQPLSELGSTAYMNLFIETKANDQLLNPNRESFGVLDYNQIPTQLCPNGHYAVEVITMDQMSQWDRLDYQLVNYKNKKHFYEKKLINKMAEYFPSFKEQILFSEVSTPQTILRYTHSPMGAIYGYLPSIDSFRERSFGLHFKSGSQDEKIKNLFFASAWSFLPGFTGALLAGHKTALELERHFQ
ncbi:MAG: phytoene desaturase family protein [Bacteriovoracaceae bacterium]